MKNKSQMTLDWFLDIYIDLLLHLLQFLYVVYKLLSFIFFCVNVALGRELVLTIECI